MSSRDILRGMDEPLAFDFITDPELRQALKDDYRELTIAIEHELWKAAHVLSGSIIEAVLVDYLLDVGKTQPDPRQMTLDALVDAAHAEGVLSEKAASLSVVVRHYRNLIHPGRILRLQDHVDREGASVAASLVRMIVREVAEKRTLIYGLTADQLLTKFEDDPLAPSIASHLLADVKEQELERLLCEAIPKRFVQDMTTRMLDDDDFAILDRLKALYREALQTAPEEVQTRTVMNFITVLREGAGYEVETLEEDLFQAKDLEYVDEEHRGIVIAHLLSRVDNEPMAINLLAPLVASPRT